MKLFKQKKGMFLILFLSLFFVLWILLSLFIRMEGKKANFPKTLGETQMNMLETYQEAEKSLFFIDQSAKYSAQQAIHILGQKAGFQDVSDCGRQSNYNLWNNKDNKECYPDIKPALSYLIDSNLNSYIKEYPAPVIPRNNYDYLIKKGDDSMTIYAFAARNIELDIKREKEKDSMGKYDIKPSFKTDINYNPFNDYETLKTNTNQILAKCPYEANVIDCITNQIILLNKPELSLSLGSCEKGAKKLFYYFIENYESCANSQDDDCICEFNMDFTGDYNLKGEYKIKLSKDASVKLEKPGGIELNHMLNTPYYAYDTSEAEEENDYIDYYINYNDDGTFNNAKLGLTRAGLDTQLTYDAVKLHKKGSRLVFVKENKGKDKCSTAKNIYKFCAIPQKQFYVYDPTINNEKPTLQNPIIKFALYMEDFPPPPIKSITLKDKPNSDKTIIIEWDKSKAQDVIEYSIYYSRDNFIEWKMEKIHKEIDSISAKAKDENKFKSIDFSFSECDFDETSKKCSFLFSAIKEDNTLDKIELKNNELYLINEEKYIYILNLPDNEQHNFAVTAVDAAGNEIDNVNEKWKLVQNKNYNQGQAEDKLAPGIVEPTLTLNEEKQVIELSWTKPLKNIDGTALTGAIKGYYIYSKENENFNSAEGLTGTFTTGISTDINYEKDTDYYIAVTAVDKNDNEFTEKVITKHIKTPK